VLGELHSGRPTAEARELAVGISTSQGHHPAPCSRGSCVFRYLAPTWHEPRRLQPTAMASMASVCRLRPGIPAWRRQHATNPWHLRPVARSDGIDIGCLNPGLRPGDALDPITLLRGRAPTCKADVNSEQRANTVYRDIVGARFGPVEDLVEL
jgi:hypothetical protein